MRVLRKRLTHAEIEAYLALMTHVTMSSASGASSHAGIEAYLAVITHALVNAFSPVRIILFGSLARGDQNRISDADLVVLS